MARRAVLFASALALSSTASLSAATPGSSDGPIRGVRGEPVARAVVRWDDIVRQGTGLAPARRRKPGPRRISRDLPVPEGALVRMEAHAEAVALPSATPLSPAPAASFEALPVNSRGGPPDTRGAVGPNHLMVTLNTEVRIQERSGRALSTVTLFDFWQGLTGGGIDGVPFDPRILYDPYADRWITSAAGNSFKSLLVGVSRTGDPTGSWNLYRVDTEWVDFPTLGFRRLQRDRGRPGQRHRLLDHTGVRRDEGPRQRGIPLGHVVGPRGPRGRSRGPSRASDAASASRAVPDSPRAAASRTMNAARRPGASGEIERGNPVYQIRTRSSGLT
jgi:hypothetical protein